MFWGDWWRGDRATSGDDGSRGIGVGDQGPFGLCAERGDRMRARAVRPALSTFGSLSVESHRHGSTAAPLTHGSRAGSSNIATDGVCPYPVHPPVHAAATHGSTATGNVV
jgi:hypothetical protein